MTANLRAMLLMTAAMAGFALEDLLIKQATGAMPPGQVLLILGLGGALAFELMARRAGVTLLSRRILDPAVVLRNGGEMLASLGIVMALAQLPLTTAATIMQALPLVVTLGAALFLGEAVGWRRWTAICVGLAGVLVIIRPGTAAFDWAMLWSVAAVLGLALRDLATRRVAADVPTLALGGWGFLSVGVIGAGMLVLSGGAVVPAPSAAAGLGAALCAGVLAYWAMTAAARIGEVAALAPFRYVRLVFAMALGMIFLSERPDWPTLAGAALIIGSGLYTFARERALARAGRQAAPTEGGAAPVRLR
jgi:drug/metabolite transporter (DMT)-like permease